MLGAGSRRRADPPPRARANTCARRCLLCSAYRPRVHVAQTPKIAAWLRARNMTEDDGYAYFVSRAAKIAIAQGRTPPVEPPPTPITDGELTAEIVDLRMVCTEAVRTLLLPCRLRPKCHTAQQSVRSRPRVRSRRTGTGTLWSFLTISHRARARPVSALLPTGRQTSSPPRRRG